MLLKVGDLDHIIRVLTPVGLFFFYVYFTPHSLVFQLYEMNLLVV